MMVQMSTRDKMKHLEHSNSDHKQEHQLTTRTTIKIKSPSKRRRRIGMQKLIIIQASILSLVLLATTISNVSHSLELQQSQASPTTIASFREVAAGTSSSSSSASYHSSNQLPFSYSPLPLTSVAVASAAASSHSPLTSLSGGSMHSSGIGGVDGRSGDAPALINSNHQRTTSEPEASASNKQQQQQQPSMIVPTMTTTTTTTTKNLCQIENGESVAIVEIEESRGSDFNQRTNPIELPIIGSIENDEIELKIESETHKFFQLNGKKLELIKALNRDPVLKENSSTLQIQQAAISSVYLQLSCLDKTKARQQQQMLMIQQQQIISSNNDSTTTTTNIAPNNNNSGNNLKRIVPVLVKVIDINDNAPRFLAQNFTVQVNELAPIGTTILGADQLRALDLDSANNGLVEYSILGQQQQQPQQNSIIKNSNLNENNNHDHDSSAKPKSMQSLQKQQQQHQSQASLPTVYRASSTMRRQSSQGLQSTISPLQQKQLQPQLQTSQQPTINVSNEPIQNGPMDDSDEESDESLLASLANSTGIGAAGNSELYWPLGAGSGGLVVPQAPRAPQPPGLPEFPNEPETDSPPSMSREPGDSSDSFSMSGAARKRAKRHHLSVLGGSNSQANKPVATNFRRSLIAAGHAASLPWTNLMDPWSSLPTSLSPSNHIGLGIGGLNQAEEAGKNLDQSLIDFFSLELSALGPVIKLKKPLDFETKPFHQLTIVATDKATNKLDRLSSSVQIFIRVTDGDDQGPAFLLEQSGCATNSIPLGASTPSYTGSSSSSSGLDGTDRLMGSSSSPNGHRVALNNPNFKITDLSDDFDFGDSADSHQSPSMIEGGLGTTSILPYPVNSLNPLLQNKQQTTSGHISGQQTTSSQPLIDYSCLSSANNNNGRQSADVVAEYWATVMAGDSDQVVRVMPQAIKARDRDQLNAPIRYNFLNGTPTNYSHYFQINALDGVVKQIAPIDRLSGLPERFTIWLEAQEQSANRHSSAAKLTIDVKAADWSPPALESNFLAGYVQENSPVGTVVWSTNKQPPTTTGSPSGETLPPDALSKPMRIQLNSNGRRISTSSLKGVYEFETTSDLFKVDKDGFVYVAQAGLDADVSGPANNGNNRKLPVYMFQVTAKLIGHLRQGVDELMPISSMSGPISARLVTTPLSLNVTLLDLDDNGPILKTNNSEPIQLQAISQPGTSRHLITLDALDRDIMPENARHQFSLLHVSNGGRDRFRLDETSGELRALGKFLKGEQFSLTIQATDSQGRSSQSILEVLVVPGPNLGAPQFLAGPVQSLVAQPAAASALIAATAATASQQQDQVSGRSAGHQPASRLQMAQIQPVSPAHLAIGDFSTEINEAIAPHSPVYQVYAQDPENDPITFHIVSGNINQDFYINPTTGAIYVQNKLDREEVSQYHLIIQARDSGGLSTARGLKIKVLDSNDENPSFPTDRYEFSVAEDTALDATIGSVRAHDADSGDFGAINYSLEISPLAFPNDNSRPLFGINKTTGEIRLLEKLDYEKAREHTLIVRAQDSDKRPRSGSCRVIIYVLDVQDEMPFFEGQNIYLETSIWENQTINEPLAGLQVKALDLDSIVQITYELKWSSAPQGTFNVDPQTGQIELLQPIDYEIAKNYTLIVGTLEQRRPPINETYQRMAMSNYLSPLLRKSPVCKIEIKILDLNDNVPKFDLEKLQPIRVKSTIQLGSQIGQVLAHDFDGSAPNNQIRYELMNSPSSSMSSSSCGDFFMIDYLSGQLRVKSDLRSQSQSECQLDLLVRDLGQEPASLSSQAQLIIYIDHIAEQPTGANMLGFSDNQFSVELSENSLPGSLVKILPVVNKLRKASFPHNCEIINGNDGGVFQISESPSGDCELRLNENQSLDYEKQHRYILSIRLNTIGGSSTASSTETGAILHATGGAVGGIHANGHNQLAPLEFSNDYQQSAIKSPVKTIARVVVNVLDRNDHKPVIAPPPARYSDLTQGRHLAIIPVESPIDTQVIQIKATDMDSIGSGNGLISYELIDKQQRSQATSDDNVTYFRIDSSNGIIRTNTQIDDVDQSKLPFRLTVLARDNPSLDNQDHHQSTSSSSLGFQKDRVHEAQTEIFVNLIGGQHRLALAFPKLQTSKLNEIKNDLLAIIQERSGLISGLERVESLKVRRRQLNSTNPQSTNQVIESQVLGTDFWFYLIEPGSFRLVPTDDVRIQRSLIDERAQTILGDLIKARLGVGCECRIRLPYQSINYDDGSSSLSSYASTLRSIFGSWIGGDSSHSAIASSNIDHVNSANSNNIGKQSTSTNNYATRVLYSLSSHYKKITDDKYAGFLISGAIFITIASFIMLIYQCFRTRPSSMERQMKKQHMRKQHELFENTLKGARMQQAAQIMQNHLTGTIKDPQTFEPQAYFIPSATKDDLQLQKQQQYHGTFNTTLGNTYESFAGNGSNPLVGSSFATNNGLNNISQHFNDLMVQQKQPNQQQQQIYSLDSTKQPQSQANNRGKEYETQMLKMSVIYDDNNSVIDDQNHQYNNYRKNINKNVI